MALEADYLRVELLDQGTVDETRAFLRAVFSASLERLRAHILIYVRTRRPLFTAGASKTLFPDVRGIEWYRSNKIAIVGNCAVLGLRGNDLETCARRLNLSIFAEEAAALRWFNDRRWGPGRVCERNYLGNKVRLLFQAIKDQRQRQDRRQSSHRNF
jgi:hypothetical protein